MTRLRHPTELNGENITCQFREKRNLLPPPPPISEEVEIYTLRNNIRGLEI